MIEQPPPRPSEGPHKRDLVELRIVNLRRELEADADPWARAAVLYEIGSLYEHDLGRLPEAVSHYAQAQLTAPEFQPATIARMRIAERERGAHELGGLCSDQIANARTSAVASSAMLDLALRSEDWASLLREAIARSPNPVVPALVLEWLAQARDDQDAVRDALRAQAGHAADPSLRAALWVDVATSEIARGEVDEALRALESACESDELAWAARSLQRRTAREHGRSENFIVATTSMAELLEHAAQSGGPIDPLRLPIAESDRLPLATLLWQEAATCCARDLGDLDAAAAYLENAIRLFPENREARLQALLLAERRGDQAGVDQASAWLRNVATDDPAFVMHQVRRAMSSEDRNDAVDFLREVVSRHPNSTYAASTLEVALMVAEAHTDRALRLSAQATTAEGESRTRLLWHAAQLTAERPDEPGKAQSLFAEAAREPSRYRVPILREAFGAALRAKHAASIIVRCGDLLGCKVEAAERAELAFCKYDVSQNLLRSDERAQQLLREALRDESNHGWAPQVARAHAALSNDFELLAEAHEILASLLSGAARIGHLSAAGLAHARAQNWDAAERALRAAMREAPEDPYPVAQLDGILREAGRTEAVVALARERSGRQSGAALGELSLLLAGATAERNADLVAARHAYEQALAEAPESPSAALALADIARRQRDDTALDRAYAALSGADLGGGVPELFALLRGDELGYASATASQASEAYEQALEHPATALSAAAALLSMPLRQTTEDRRSAAEEAFADAEVPLRGASNGFDAAFGPLRVALGDEDSSSGDAWLRLAALAPTEELRAATLLHGLRATRLTRGEESADELFMLAQEIAQLPSPEAAVAVDEVLLPGDEPELRAASLQRKLHHSGALGRGALQAAHCRALVDGDRGAEAVRLLSNAVDERPDDLALWETLRVAARRAEQWPMVAQACERLAPFVDGSLKADLLEEAGVVRLDCLKQFQQAEDLFRSALEEDPTRDVAFRRLRDLLAARQDAEALEELVSERLAAGGPKDRLALLYERARLLRGFSDRPGALEVLDELFASKPNHAGALALAAEVHVSLSQWEEAIECLRKLSRANIPDEQRRVAHLGAADFLETRLGRPGEALAELRAVDDLDLADAVTLVRIGAHEEALEQHEAAADAYARALDHEPTQANAIAGLVRLLDEAERGAAVARYEQAIWERVDAGGLDEELLYGVRNAASWRGQPQRATAVLAALRALGLRSPVDEAHWAAPAHAAADLVLPDGRDSALQGAILQADSAFWPKRLRTKAASSNDPVVLELKELSSQFGAHLGAVDFSDDRTAVIARRGRGGELEWVVPGRSRTGLDGPLRFVAGRLAWATPRGAGWMLDDSAQRAAGTLAAILRASRCSIASGEPVLPAAEVKLRRAVRKRVHEVVGEARLTPAALLAFAQSMQQSADRAGFLACHDLEPALSTVLRGTATLTAVKTSPRALSLLRFAIAHDSPLWGNHA